MRQALWVGGVCGVLALGCSDGSSPKGVTSGIGAGAQSLAGTWDIAATPTGETNAIPTTVTIGQDSLAITSASFSLTATRTGNTLAFTDEQSPGNPGDNITLAATQTAATFDTGIIPFNLGGSWMMQIAPAGQSAVTTCTLTVSPTEIDGACQKITDGFDFAFTTKKMSSSVSDFGDFGGTWMNVWTYPGDAGTSTPCMLSFVGNTITTCPGGAMNGEADGALLAGITFTYDGANTASGAAQGWTEYSATRR
jgi:hypothetical protein